MRWVLNKQLVIVVLVTFACYALAFDRAVAKTLTVGKPTADAATTFRQNDTANSVRQLPLRFGLAANGAYAQPDTTEFEFPEEDKSHLVRDVTIFVIVSVFVAYFVIKVFLEGDTGDETTDSGGKDVPGG